MQSNQDQPSGNPSKPEPPARNRGKHAGNFFWRWLEGDSWKQGFVSAGRTLKRTALFTGSLWGGLWLRSGQIPTAQTASAIRQAASREALSLFAWALFSLIAMLSATQASSPWNVILLVVGCAFVFRAGICLYIMLAARQQLRSGKTQEGPHE